MPLGEPSNNLGPELSSFVGRRAEVSEIAALLGTQRLVTLVGAGGIGKTRTALHVAANLLDDGSARSVWLIELAPLSSGDYVPAAVARAMRFALPPGSEPIDLLVRALRTKTALLVFDNCEHLVESVAGVVAAILSGCPGLRVLATSRQRLGVTGEATYRMPSLTFPSADEAERIGPATAARYSAIELFIARAAAADQRFALGTETAPEIAQICRQLDGIPFAIELAAARLKVLDPRQLRERLDERLRLLTGGSRDVPPRQQTLRALIDWSYDLLDERARQLFRGLGIFVNGFTIEGATAIGCSAEIDEFDLLDVLASLVDKSLVQVERDGAATRYRLLESTRLYAREKLEAAGEREAAAARHLRFLCERFRDAAERREQTARESELDELLAAELDDVRAALDGARSGSELRCGGELLAAIDTRWYFSGLLGEGRRRLERFATALAGDDPVLLSKLWCSYAALADDSGRTSRGHAAAMKSVALARASGDPAALAGALRQYARRAAFSRRFEEAEAALAEAEAIPEKSAYLRQGLLVTRGFLSGFRGDLDAGIRAFEVLLTENRALGNTALERWAKVQLSEFEHQRGRTERAIALARELLPAARAGADRGFYGTVLAMLAGYLAAVDDVSAASEAAREAIRHVASHDPQSRMIGVSVEQLALALALSDDLRRAALLAGYADAAARTQGYDREYTERTTYLRLSTVLRERLGAAEHEVLLAEGAGLTVEAAIALALAEG